LNQEIDEWGPNVVWVWGWSFDSHLRAMRYFKGKVPVWFRGDSTLLDERKGFSFNKIVRRVFLKWVYKHVDKAFFVGTHNKDYYSSHGLKSNQLVEAPHAIDNERFSENNETYGILLNEFRMKLDIDKTNIVFLFAGKLEPKKNPFFMLELADHLKDSNYKFLIVGNGQLENEVKWASVHDNRIKFLDFQNQTMMPVLYRLATFYVLPSKGPGETWGLALNEALASGTPIIASNKCGGAIDLINYSNGYILYPNNTDFNDLETWIFQFDVARFIKKNICFLEKFNLSNFVKQVTRNN
jgi:glycosyltransferase involved in cell wall biosynthesis